MSRNSSRQQVLQSAKDLWKAYRRFCAITEMFDFVDQMIEEEVPQRTLEQDRDRVRKSVQKAPEEAAEVVLRFHDLIRSVEANEKGHTP